MNSIRWDSSGKYLASCADDRTAKVWKVENDVIRWVTLGTGVGFDCT